MKLAYLFPGQGSQSLGMMAEMAAVYPLVKELYAQASDILGYDLWQVVQNDQEKLNQTQVTQPALLVADVATSRIWQAETGLQASMVAGHSLGEYAALVEAGAVDFAQAVALVAARGEAMQAAVPAGQGAMAAILGLEDDQVAEVCTQASTTDEKAEPANFNSPGQVVIAGHAAAVKRAEDLAKEAGAKRVVPLAVSVPSHCFLMKAAADKLAEAFDKVTFKAPQIEVINNVDVAHPQGPEAIEDALLRQLYRPVRWVETIALMKDNGITHFLEMGPGKVLAGLIRRIDRTASTYAITDPEALVKAKKAILGAEA